MKLELQLWQRMWLLFTVIWVFLSLLNAGTILAFSDEVEWFKAVRPVVLGFVVPAVLYFLIWGYVAWRSRRRPAKSGSDPE